METIAIIISMIAMLLWLRTEANADRRETRSIQSEDRKELLKMVNAIKEDVAEMKRKNA